MKKILILFKTHLDIGFTGGAEAILKHYCDAYIPAALETAFTLRNTDTPFIWTTGSFLIREYLRRKQGAERKRMEQAIGEGLISWHGLPFTTHTELMDEDLFRHGLSISEKLGKRYRISTIAAKMTDVPGHTIQMVPLLVEKGIRFLHIGVNEACRPPEVPELFRWKSPEGAEIMVMYQSGYGKFAIFDGGEKAVYFAHTNDNLGPQGVEEVRHIYKELQKKYPEAVVRAGNLNDLAAELLNEWENLPVITEEIGDTWIHGAGTDPAKIFCYREILRMAKQCSQDEREAVYDKLMLIPEHTWGLDEKSFMLNHTDYDKENFQKLRQTEGAKKLEQSWREQRGYLCEALNCLPEHLREQAEKKLAEYKREEIDVSSWNPVTDKKENIEIGVWKIGFQKNGAICLLTRKEQFFADEKHLLGLLFYELFSENEYDKYLASYLIARPEWALEDNKKIGMSSSVSAYCRIEPKLLGVYRKRNVLLVKLAFPKEVAEQYGCPRRAEYTLCFEEDRVTFDVAWFQKDACRCAEAIWFSMEPPGSLQAVSKFGKKVDLNRICSWGNRHLHATDVGILYNMSESETQEIKKLVIETVDTALVSAGGAALLNEENRLPKDCLHPNRADFNLYNNIWGTNFPMWYDEDARFRFRMKCME